MTTYVLQYYDGNENKAIIVSDPHDELKGVANIFHSYPELFDDADEDSTSINSMISIPDDWEPEVKLDDDDVISPLLRKTLPL